jgi:hypothetical protein
MPANSPRDFTKFVWPAGVVALTLLVAGLIFKSYLFHPNQHLYAFGGDPLVIYYDLIYHARFDHGAMLGGMNYPYGEFIFLTDAQGAIGSILQWVNRHFFDTGNYIPGIVHSLNIFFLPVCSLMVFYILVNYNVRKWLALVFAVLITFLSPAMLRFGNHFGLAYPFVIPLTMLWFLRKYNIGKIEVRDFLVLGILIFFTLNNPYIGFGASAFLIGSGLLLFLHCLKHHMPLLKGGIVCGIGLLAALIPFLIMHFNDPMEDRLQQQWGFSHYNATPQGLLFPPLSILENILTHLKVTIRAGEFESYMNIGLVSFLSILGIITLLIKAKFRMSKLTGWKIFSIENLVLLGGASMMFLLAANRSIIPISKEWMENHLGPLLMFKASARLGWSFYFAITISVVLFLDQVLKKLKSPVIVVAIALVCMITWASEIKSYVASRYTDCYHAAFLGKQSEDEILNIVRDHHINIPDYQAMLVLPKMMAWNDDFISDIQWASQFFSMRLSAATGLPMISAMLSRMSISQCAESIQLMSNPVVHRDLIPKLPNQKDLLLLVGGENLPLTVGEQYLIDISKPLYRSKDFSLYKLTLDSLQHNSNIREAQNLYRQHPLMPKDVIHLSFDNLNTSVSFYGPGSRYIDKGQTIIVDQVLTAEKDTQYVFSAWSKVDYHQAGVAEWHLIIQDSLGQVITEKITETRKSNDIQDLWIRSEITFFAPKGSRIQATAISRKGIYIDEILIYPIHATSIVDLPTSSQFLFNGYKVDKPE